MACGLDLTPPPRRGLRLTLWLLAAIIVLPLIAGAAWLATVDPNAYKDRIEAAVLRATGRELALHGPLHLAFAPELTVEATDVALANMPGGSRPEMARAQTLRARIGLWALLQRRLELTSLVLVRPDVLFETNSAGVPNWHFSPPPRPATTGGAAPAPPGEATGFALRGIRIEDGSFAWRDGRTGHSVALGVARFSATSDSDDAPITVAGEIVHRGQTIELAGQFGSVAALRAASPAAPWPMRVGAAVAGAQVDLRGTVASPFQGRGYALKLSATAADLARLAPLFPRVSLPALHEATLAADIADVGTGQPELSGVVMHVGASDLDRVLPGLALTRLDLRAAGVDASVQLDANGSFSGVPLHVAGTVGALKRLLPGAPAEIYPVDVSAEAAGARLAVKGGVARPTRMTGLDLMVALRVPDLSALAPLVRRPLPRVRDIALDAALTDHVAGGGRGVALTGLTLTWPQGDLAGDAALSLGSRPGLRATLAATRIDLDGLPEIPSAPVPPAVRPAAPSLPPAPPPAPPLPSGRAAPRLGLVPDFPLPFGLLNRSDADLTLRIGTMRSGGVDYREFAGHLALQEGRLRLDPFSVQLPGGKLALRLEVDAAQPAPPVVLALRAPGLALRPLLQIFGLPAEATGTLEVAADLRSAGATPHELAARLDGQLGLSLVNGSLDNRLLGEALDTLVREAKLPLPPPGGAGQSDVRCFALRLDASNGVAGVRALMLDMSRLRLTGAGAIDLGGETLALRLRPLVKVAGSGLVVPARIGGSFLTPKLAIEPAGAVESAAGFAARLGRDSLPEGLAGVLEGQALLGAADTGDCAPALALARFGQPGPAAAAPRPEKGPNARDLLRGLLR